MIDRCIHARQTNDKKNMNIQQLVHKPIPSRRYPKTIGQKNPPKPPRTPTIILTDNHYFDQFRRFWLILADFDEFRRFWLIFTILNDFDGYERFLLILADIDDFDLFWSSLTNFADFGGF